MKRSLLFILPIALVSLTGCGCGPFGFFHRGDQCTAPCNHFDACAPSGCLGGTIVGEGGIPTIIEGAPGVRPGPVETVAPR